ncbi:MAG: prenyltransferase/squalene oxidase repeat-containing protein [Thermoproteota archaeon]
MKLEMRFLLKRNKADVFVSVILLLVFTFLILPVPHTVSANQDEKDQKAYGCITVIPRGTITDNVVWKYVKDTQPECGWNVGLRYDDANWLEGTSPIGSPRYFVRTNISSREIFLRKIFRINKMPKNAIFNIAVYGSIDVWINGRKVLSGINALHKPTYWNYRLNATEYLEEGENLLAVHIQSVVSEVYFDCELLLEEKSLEERIIEFVKKQRIDNYFSLSYSDIETVFYITSILKALNKIDLIDRNKTITWIMSHRTIDGELGEGVFQKYCIVETLKNLNYSLKPLEVEYLVRKTLESYFKESKRKYELSHTYYMLNILESLNMLDRIGNTNEIIETILSLYANGYFIAPVTHLSLEQTFYAVKSLKILKALDLINKTEVIDFLLEYYNSNTRIHIISLDNTTLIYKPVWQNAIKESFWIVELLKILNSLEKIDIDKMVERAITFGERNDYYLVMLLQTLGRLNMFNVTSVNYLMNGYNPIDGSFKSGGDLKSTEHALRILKNLEKLDIIDGSMLVSSILSMQSEFFCKANNTFCDIENAYRIVSILTTIGSCEEIDKNSIIEVLMKHQNPDGGFSHVAICSYNDGDKYYLRLNSSLLNTYLGVEILRMLDMLSSYDIKPIKNYVLSLKNPDGSFGNSIKDTAMAVITLALLQSTEEIEETTIQYILKGQEEDGGFGDLESTYFSLRALHMLNRLNDAVFSKAVNYVLNLRNDDGGFSGRMGELKSRLDYTDYATSILSLRKPKKYYVKIISNPESASHGVCGSGWYFAGTNATLSADSMVCNPHEKGKRFIFKGWNGDVISDSQRITIAVDSNKSIVTNWKTQYLVTYYGPSPFSTTKHEEWYDERRVFKINTTEVFDKDPMSDYVFDHWEVDGKALYGSTLEIEVDSPKEIIAIYRVELNLVKTVTTVLKASLVSIAILVAATKIALTLRKIRRKKDKSAVNRPKTDEISSKIKRFGNALRENFKPSS